MGKRSKDPLADWTGPQIDRSSLESVLDSYFESLRDEPTSAPEITQQTSKEEASVNFQNIQKDATQKQSVINEITKLTGSVTGSITQPIVPSMPPPVSVRLDATHAASESVIYSVMYRETHSKGTRTKRFSIPELMNLSGIRSKNTVRRALAGLKDKLSIRELEPAQATLPPLYEVRKIREIFADRSAAGIEIKDRKVVSDKTEVFHRTQPLTRSKIDPLTRSKIDPLFKYKDPDINMEEDPTRQPVEKIGEDKPASPVIEIFEDVLNRRLTVGERERVISEMSNVLREWAIAKSINASEPIREVTYFLNGFRQALTPKQATKEIEPDKLRRWMIRLLKDKWPTPRERVKTDIGDASEYIKQCFAKHRINYSPHVSIISAVIAEWYKGTFDQKTKEADLRE